MQAKAVYQVNGNGNGHNGHTPAIKPLEVYQTGTAPDPRLQPHHFDSEEALLGSIIISADSLVHCDEVGLGPADFFIHKHGTVFDAMKALGPRCDLVTLSDELERRGQLEDVGGLAWLTGLMNSTPTHINAPYYARIIKRESIRRSLITAAGDIARLSYDSEDDDPQNIIQAASDILLKVATGNQTGEARPAGYYCDKFLDNLDGYYKSNEETNGLPTGLTGLDKMLGGLQRGKLILLGGRPGMGKSSMVLQMAKTAIQRRRANVLYFSLEMIGEELIERLVSAGAGIDTDLMRSKKLNTQNFEAINRTLAEVSGWPLVIDDKTQNIEAIRARAVSHSFNPGLDLIVVDYGQRVTTGKHYQNRDAELGAVSAAFKRLANDLQVPVVVVASLSRECERRHDKRPILSDLRDSGNWEYDADVVIFAYWDAVYNPESENQNIVDFIVAKHRGGKTGIVSTYFRKHLTMFADLEVKRQELNY